MRVPHRSFSEMGGALIEFVLVLPLFLVLLLGAIDWGWYFVIRETALNAAREGARVGSVAPSGAAQTNASAAVQSYLQNALGSDYVQDPAVDADGCTIAVGATSFHCVSVALTDYPVVPGRPDSSITGLDAWTRAPTRFNVAAKMRLEVQP